MMYLSGPELGNRAAIPSNALLLQQGIFKKDLSI